MNKKVRIGIDVGGTFTDAVVIDSETYEVVAKKKIPTTHEEGVAVGVVTLISQLMKIRTANTTPIPIKVFIPAFAIFSPVV